MILGANGRPYVQLGGEFARNVRVYGNLVVSFQYVNTEPAMVIWSATRKKGAFAICLSAAHDYTEDNHLVFQAAHAAHVIGLDPMSKSDVGSIADAIQSSLDELVKMPPEPRDAVARREQKAEVTLRSGGAYGDIIGSQEVLHDPFEQPSI